MTDKCSLEWWRHYLIPARDLIPAEAEGALNSRPGWTPGRPGLTESTERLIYITTFNYQVNGEEDAVKGIFWAKCIALNALDRKQESLNIEVKAEINKKQS